ncbi:hypothetical protein L228DRAFT_8683 [Xylona heveae TC161]|uniref:Uncharacterized protein n=1 Tax=Xylona heveae (strain CBS 132557 / TC161) TaxID=1328760 RepID=A0A165JI07_XYLHT|nr:hypothetical protein L228DRAFT_8683 [Xylona heveae TC161]KZF26265.1 hypothetical protein L228DRAFT_8683 [Xylona heveae TC161]
MSRSSRPTTGAGTTNGVDRNTSIRSIMTLPAYAPAPRPTEQILGREGDRAGIDVVVEYPETAEEEETRREQQMSSLYQIRLARRAEAAEREAQRRLRREARSRGDNTTLEELRVRSRLRAESASSVGGNGGPGASTTSLSSASLIQEHAARERDRRIPSVSYADVGLARHDGSRVRANSNDSDRPLLTSVASTGARSRSGSNLAWHDRTRSATSVLSLSTTNSGGNGNRPPMGDPNGSDFEEISLQPTLASSHGTPPESDIAEARSLIHPDEHPPEYEHVDWGDAPPYEHDNDHFHDIRTSDDVDGDDDDEDTPLGTASRSASDSSSSSNHHDTHRESTSQPPVLPALHTLPAIEITGTTPASSAPPTPVSPHSREPREMS